jgi:mono/diheme cytochrome c family protein
MPKKPTYPLLVWAVATWLTALPAYADATKGEQIARQWCASCHAIGGNPAGPVPQGPPSFHMVASSRMTADQLRAFLSHPHRAMPNLALTRAEIDDLIGYVDTLRLGRGLWLMASWA